MKDEPLPNGSNGQRDEQGRFRKGHRGGPGNPHARRVAKFRKALLNCVTTEDFEAVVRAIVTAAKAGDMSAAKLLLDRLLGPVRTEIDATVSRGPAAVIELPMREFLAGFETETFEKEPNE